MHHCPPEFNGTLADFVDQHVKPNLLSPKGVAEFHNGLMEYLNSDDALYILRQMGITVRFRRGVEEKTYSTNKGTLKDFWSCYKTKWWWSKKRRMLLRKIELI